MDLQPLLSIASFVLVTLVVRPSIATIPASSWFSRRVRRSGTSWSLLGWGCWLIWSRQWGDLWYYGCRLCAYRIRSLLDTVHWCYWLSSQFGLQRNIPSFDELKVLFCLSLALEFIEGGEIDHVPWLVQIVQYRSALRSQWCTLINGLDYSYGLG